MKRIITDKEIARIGDIKPRSVIVAKNMESGDFVGFVRKDYYSQGYVLGFADGNIIGGSFNKIERLIDAMSGLYEFYLL